MARQETKAPRKRRGIDGGLDNLVTQAELRKLDDMFVFDADAHLNELFSDIAKYVPDPKWKGFFRSDPEEEPMLKEALRVFENNFPNIFKRVKRPETSFPGGMPVSEVIDVFTQRMHDIGIKQSIVFPGVLASANLD